MWRSEAQVNSIAPQRPFVAEQSYEMYMPGTGAGANNGTSGPQMYEKTMVVANKNAAGVSSRRKTEPETRFEQSSVNETRQHQDTQIVQSSKTGPSVAPAGDNLAGSAQGKTRHRIALPTVLGTTTTTAAATTTTTSPVAGAVDQKIKARKEDQAKDDKESAEPLNTKQPLTTSFAAADPLTKTNIQPRQQQQNLSTRPAPKNVNLNSAELKVPKKKLITPETAQLIRKIAISVTAFLVTAAAVFVILLLINPPFVQRKCDATAAAGEPSSSSSPSQCLEKQPASIWKIGGLSLVAGGTAAAIPFLWKHAAPTIGPMLKIF